MENVASELLPLWLNQRVNVIGHDHERVEVIAVAVEKPQRVGDYFCRSEISNKHSPCPRSSQCSRSSSNRFWY